jgi:hypothetical protein
MLIIHLISLLIFTNCTQSNSWQTIIPLRSTRADVEKVLGQPVDDSKAVDAVIYKTDNERIFVLYSTGPCNSKPSSGWNVAANTVISLSVDPNKKPRFSDYNLDESRYEKRPDREVRYLTYYINEQDGIRLVVNTEEGVIKTFEFLPKSEDYKLRCSNYPQMPDQHPGPLPIKFDEYSSASLRNERKRLEAFGKRLLNLPATQAFIIAYAGRRARPGEANAIAERAKQYLINRSKVDIARIETIDGGYRDKWAVELYLIPLGVVPPSPKPTVLPSDVQIIKRRS